MIKTKTEYKAALFSLIIAAIGIYSCNRCIDLRLFNHSKQHLVIEAIDDSGATTASWRIAPEDSSVVWLAAHWKVRSGNLTWYYDDKTLWYPDKSYSSLNWFHCLHMTAQINANGEIWILSPDAASSADSMPPQPPKYPVKPERVQR
jgi:hypothetical protein